MAAIQRASIADCPAPVWASFVAVGVDYMTGAEWRPFSNLRAAARGLVRAAEFWPDYAGDSRTCCQWLRIMAVYAWRIAATAMRYPSIWSVFPLKRPGAWAAVEGATARRFDALLRSRKEYRGKQMPRSAPRGSAHKSQSEIDDAAAVVLACVYGLVDAEIIEPGKNANRAAGACEAAIDFAARAVFIVAEIHAAGHETDPTLMPEICRRFDGGAT